MAKARDYKREYANYQGSEQQKHNRAERNAARRELVKEGVVKKGDGKDVDHKRAISMGGTNARGNLRAVSASDNRSFPRKSSGAMKRNT